MELVSSMPTITLSLLGATFGIIAFVMVYKAKQKLAGGSLYRYVNITSIALLFLILASLWHSFAVLTNLHHNYGDMSTLPHYVLMVFAYMVFILGSYQVLYISEEFSFSEQAATVKQALAKPKNKRKK